MMSRFGEQDIINNITQQIDTSSITNTGETSSPSPQAAPPESVPTRVERKRNKEQGGINREALTFPPSSVTITEPPLPVYKDRTPHQTSTRDRSTFTFPPAVTIAIEEEKEEKEEAAVTESSNSSIKQKNKKNKNKQTVETVSPTSEVIAGLLSKEGEEDDVSEDISNNSPSAAAATTSPDNSDSKKKQKQEQNQQQQKEEEEQTAAARTTSSPSSTVLLNPTQFPTYLGTSYFPTYGWPTYAPSTFESMPSQKRHMITQREKKAAAKQLAADLAAGITSEPTASMIPTVKVVTEPPTRMRFYGSDRDASFRTEAIDTPSPTAVTVTSKDEPSVDKGEGEVQGPSRYSYSRPGGDYHSSRYTDKPTKSKEVDNEALLRMENKTLEEIEGERFSTPTNSPSAPTPPDGTTPSRWSGPSRGDDESSRDYSHGGYHRTSYPTITYPTDFPTTFEPTTRKPTNSPIGTPTYTPSVSPIAPKNMDLTIRNGQPPTPKLSDTGSKVNLSFNIQRPTQKPTSSKMNLQFFGGRGKPTVPPMTTAPPISSRWRQTMPPSQKPVSTEEPTYLIFPTYSPSSASTIPETAVTSSPPTIWPTYLPTASHTSQDKDEYANDRDWTWKSTTTVSSEDEQEDNDEMMAATSIYEKRTCPRYPFGVDPKSPKVEEQVFFTYGVQTATTAQEGFHSSSIEEQVEHIQLSLLNDVANHIVLCPNDETSVSMTRSRFGDGSNILLDGGKFQQSTVRVYYMEDEAIATMSKCMPTVADATDCAIVKSSIYVTVDTRYGEAEDARANALSVIHHHLERGVYEQSPLLHTSYLGPDISKLSLISSHNSQASSTLNGNSSGGRSGSSAAHPPIFWVAIVMTTLAVLSLFAFLVMAFKVQKERRRRAGDSVVVNMNSGGGNNHRSTVREDFHRPSVVSQSHNSAYDRRHLLDQGNSRF